MFMSFEYFYVMYFVIMDVIFYLLLVGFNDGCFIDEVVVLYSIDDMFVVSE